MTPAWTIVEYPGRDGLMRLQSDWNRLVAAMPDAGFQHLHETYVGYFDNLQAESGAFSCLALSDGTRVRAICPVEPQRAAVFRVFQSPVWGLPTGLGDVPRDVICAPDPDAEAALFPCVVEHLRRTRPRRGWLVLNRVLEGSAAWRCLRHCDAGQYYADMDGAVHLIDCDRPFPDLMAGLSRKFRGNLRTAHNRLAKLPDVRFVRTVDAAQFGAVFDRYLRVEASGWKGTAGTRTAVALRPNHLAFYRSWIAALGASGRCDFSELRSGDECLACTLCIRVTGECTVLKISYDERFANIAPSHLLLEYVLQQCCEDPSIKRLDLVTGATWKLVWAPAITKSYNAYLGVGGWTARVRVALLRMSFRYWPVVKRWLQRARAGRRAPQPAARSASA